MTNDYEHERPAHVEKHGGWKAAKGDYRIFVGLFPTGALADEVQALRERYDPVTAAITGVHVTLAGLYWRNGAPVAATEAATIDALRAALAPLPPVEMVLQGVDTFRSDVAFLSVRENEAMLADRKSVV